MPCIVDKSLNPAALFLILGSLAVSFALHFACYFPLARKMVVSEEYRMWRPRRLASLMSLGSCLWIVVIWFIDCDHLPEMGLAAIIAVMVVIPAVVWGWLS